MEVCIDSYFARLDSFVESYRNYIDSDRNSYIDGILHHCISHGCFISFEFSKYVYYSNIYIENRIVTYCISRSFIQNGIYVSELWNKNPVRNLWFPNSPSKEFCLQLLNESACFSKEIAILSVMKNWSDVFELCPLSVRESFGVKCLIFRLNRKNSFIVNSNFIHTYFDRVRLLTSLYNQYFHNDVLFKPYFLDLTDSNYTDAESFLINYILENHHFAPYISDTDVSLDDIYKSSYIACRVFIHCPDSLKSICVSRFLISGYINHEYIRKHRPKLIPFKFCSKLDSNQLFDLYHLYDFLRPLVLKILVISNDYITYKRIVSTPELFIFNIARHVCDSFIYKDQVSLANKYGGFYSLYNEDNGESINQIFYPTSNINYVFDFRFSIYNVN